MASPSSSSSSSDETKGQRGLFVVFEGADGCGKTTHAEDLYFELERRGTGASFVGFPVRSGFVGRIIDRYLKGDDVGQSPQVMQLLFAAGRWEMAEEIKSLLLSGKTVVCDRYSYSGVVYGSCAEGLPEEWCADIEVGLPKPDLVFLLTGDPKKCAKRSDRFGEERYDDIETQQKVSNKFRQLIGEKEGMAMTRAHTLDTVECDKDAVHLSVLNIYDAAHRSKRSKDIPVLRAEDLVPGKWMKAVVVFSG